MLFEFEVLNSEHFCKPSKYGKLSKFRFTMIRFMRHKIVCKIPHINDHTFPLLPQELPIYWLTGFPTYQLQTRFSNCVSGRSEMSEWQLGCFPYTPFPQPLCTLGRSPWQPGSPPQPYRLLRYIFIHRCFFLAIWTDHTMVLCSAKYSNPFREI